MIEASISVKVLASNMISAVCENWVVPSDRTYVTTTFEMKLVLPITIYGGKQISVSEVASKKTHSGSLTCAETDDQE